MQADEKTENEIIDVLHQYVKSYVEKSITDLMDIVSSTEDTVLIGTGPDEWVSGPSEIKKGFERDLKQSDALEIEFGDINVSLNGDMAWTATTMTMKASINNKTLTLKGRVSFVFEKIENKWLIAHLHYSLPNDEQGEGKSFPEVN
ncbi:nuclear transport factor 2 family protein [Methanobacterium alcaliphilum]|uniref:nuclear transport factor 2 family protein n=1 Tax=Methanobacterium alcaliphilum TaxID=392018 RepID=UPI00200A9F0B|nr:nuclear transport factor 2 family protein [Methanobacterium alcaliphilum]MCK9151203.1 nuclear transport factor 2 family protein [Methanobacterium alcaliphilum]